MFFPVFQRYFSTSMFAPKRGLRLSKDEARNVEYRLSALDADAPPACPLYPGKKTNEIKVSKTGLCCYSVDCVSRVLRD